MVLLLMIVVLESVLITILIIIVIDLKNAPFKWNLMILAVSLL